MTAWASRVTYSHTKVAPEAILDAIEILADHAAVATIDRSGLGGSIQLTVEAESAEEAARMSAHLVNTALTPITDPKVIGIDTMTQEAFEAELQRPVIPELVGLSEIADMASVTRQRAHQLARTPGFPPVVVETRQGPLMTKAAVSKWVERRKRRTVANA